jgi:hypothetical protein
VQMSDTGLPYRIGAPPLEVYCMPLTASIAFSSCISVVQASLVPRKQDGSIVEVWSSSVSGLLPPYCKVERSFNLIAPGDECGFLYGLPRSSTAFS